jgi:nucleoid DNA-binding protein
VEVYFHGRGGEVDEFEQLPERIQRQIVSIAESSGLPEGRESLERVTENWLRKQSLFEEQTRALAMVPIDEQGCSPTGGMLLLTYSGSLVVLGPETDSGRSLEYVSIALRTDVPDILRADGVRLSTPVETGAALVLENSPIERSSELYAVRGFPADLDTAEQKRRLQEAAIFLTNGFTRANHTLTAEADSEIEHFTMRSVVAYVAKRSGLTQTKVREVLDDYLTTIESGALLGERVPLGRLGRLYLSVRQARKARVVKSPSTGEEVLVGAKPETAVPRFSFSSRLKERASEVPTQRIIGEPDASDTENA